MDCIELCGGVHTVQIQTSAQIPIAFCVYLSVSESVSVSGSVKHNIRMVIILCRLNGICDA